MRDRITFLIKELTNLKINISEGRTISSSAATLITGFGLQLALLYEQLCGVTNKLTAGQMLTMEDMKGLHETGECLQLVAQALADTDGSLRDAMEGSQRTTTKPQA